ncbi:MAG: hypothetical protein DMF63_12570 [Acidobacteria bacterium]|nr:MAG: hypothetical protein DMF63_12570 [Acidobacteriota bacterium]
MQQIVKLIIAAIFLSVPICAQQPTWDLSYESVLEQNKVTKTEWIRTWLKTTKSPAVNWISEWKGKPMVSSILIEHPAFHAAERTTTWLIRTENEAFYWNEVEGTRSGRVEEPIDTRIYDAIYKDVTSWQQAVPKSAKESHPDALPGYIGFLSHTGPDGSGQILLTMDDFVICLDESCLPGKGTKLGRLMAAVEPILIPDAQKNYKHKTDAELARMTPEERIDEQVKELDHLTDSTDKQHALFRKYRIIDGVKGARRLVELIDTYEPKRLRNPASEAIMIAGDIDENSARLRGSPEGRSIIEAIERVAARMRELGNADESKYLEDKLRQMKGVNFTDHAVRDTLWMIYRINLSDTELLEFTNYLVQHHPTYPSWSDRYTATDNSKKRDPSLGTLLLIMKEPIRYHEAYLAFKRTAISR